MTFWGLSNGVAGRAGTGGTPAGPQGRGAGERRARLCGRRRGCSWPTRRSWGGWGRGGLAQIEGVGGGLEKFGGGLGLRGVRSRDDRERGVTLGKLQHWFQAKSTLRHRWCLILGSPGVGLGDWWGKVFGVAEKGGSVLIERVGVGEIRAKVGAGAVGGGCMLCCFKSVGVNGGKRSGEETIKRWDY